MAPQPDISPYVQSATVSFNKKKWEDITEKVNIFISENLNKCTKCNEFIDIFCDNPEFSAQLHKSKSHKAPNDIIDKNSNWKYEESVNLICPVCEKYIPIINNQVAQSVFQHVEKSTRRSQFTRLLHQLTFIAKGENLIQNAFSSTLKILKNHEGYFSLKGSNLFCQLCNHNFGSNNENLKTVCTMINGHISSKGHKSRHEAENQKIVNAILCYNKEISSQHEHTQLNRNLLSKKYKSSSTLFNKNKKFLEKNGVHYVCNICKKRICYSPNENTQILNLIFHFIGVFHKRSLFFKTKNNYCLIFPTGVCDGRDLIYNNFGYTYDIVRKVIDTMADQGKSKGTIRAPGGGGISAPPRNSQAEDDIVRKVISLCVSLKQTLIQIQTNSQVVQQPPNIVITDIMSYDSVRALNQHPTFAPHMRLLKVVEGNCVCTLCNVILTIPFSETQHLVQHICGSRHSKLSKEQNIPVPDRSYICPKDGDGQLVGTSPRDQIHKLYLEKEFAPHVKYLKLEGNKCECLICGVYLSVSMYVNHNLKDHIRGSFHQKNFESLGETDTDDDDEDDDSSDLTDAMENLQL